MSCVCADYGGCTGAPIESDSRFKMFVMRTVKQHCNGILTSSVYTKNIKIRRKKITGINNEQ